MIAPHSKTMSMSKSRSYFLGRVKFRMWYFEMSRPDTEITQLVLASDKEKASDAVKKKAREEDTDDEMTITGIKVLDTIIGE